ncbi:helix-turn-helix domain-containing protein [Pseudomonas sp. J452]|uniref:helix-turn-helix domain-containing protein n=1 Tax=Pseudomonas sp. J452 TaxID=2898441 RepID=UPI0021AD70DF|nr:helix-turn-helix domain-containing protein [Pseudomonas sp. J452]UUY07069.1 helix-turn-helix domain-containing protein [Pseudomonas sp. J452]
MSRAAYDSKNEESFEAGTRALDEALNKIQKNPSISANVSQLAKLAGVHRNTIYHREWPLERLKEIKAQRAKQKKDLAAANAEIRSPEELLELSRLEIVYWFTQIQDARATNTVLLANLRKTEEARDMYMEDHQKALGVNRP